MRNERDLMFHDGSRDFPQWGIDKEVLGPAEDSHSRAGSAGASGRSYYLTFGRRRRVIHPM